MGVVESVSIYDEVRMGREAEEGCMVGGPGFIAWGMKAEYPKTVGYPQG